MGVKPESKKMLCSRTLRSTPELCRAVPPWKGRSAKYAEAEERADGGSDSRSGRYRVYPPLRLVRTDRVLTSGGSGAS